MRICLLSDGYPPWDRGGAQKIARNLAEGYAARGHEVDVITTVADREYAGRDDCGRDVGDGVTVHRLYAPRPHALLPYLTVHNPFVARDCARALDRVDPDVVHAHNVHWLSNASLRAAARRAPVVKTYHDAGTFAYGEFTALVDETPVGGPVPEGAYRASPRRQAREQGLRYFPLRNRLNRRTIERCVDVGVAVSDALRRGLRANGIPCRRTIRNGVDASVETATDGGAVPLDNGGQFGQCALPDAEASFRDQYGIGSGPFVLFGGRTGPTKGGRHLAAAFGRVCETVDADVSLLVTGDSGDLDRMRALAGPDDHRIVATGWIPRAHLRTAFAAAGVVATPSVHLDPFPTVNLEAFAAGTPVVTTRFGGADELVDDGEDGVVVDPRDVEALAEGLESFLAAPRRAARYGAAGRRKVGTRFTLERQVDSYLDVLASVA